MVGVRRLPDGRRSCRKGATALELALITPLLVLMMLGCIDFGRFPATSMVVRNAARVGADFVRTNLYPSVPAAQELWKTRLRSAVLSELRTLKDFDETRLTRLHVTGLDPGKTQADPQGDRFQVKVEVGYRFKTLVTFLHQGDPLLPDGQVLPNELDLRQQVVMDIPKAPGRFVPPDTDF
jgi:TadE-like protein